VAGSVQGKRGCFGLSPRAAAFQAPPGDGRSGANGIVVRARPEWTKTGTTWAFRYQRRGSAWGVQILHPFRGGQVIVHLSRGRVGISTPRAWAEVGYTRGYAREPERTADFADLFPLKDRFVYEVRSTLSANGHFQLKVSDKVVATATVKAARPVSFEIPEGKRFPGASGWAKLEFAGKGFPTQWEIGYAGLLIEPLDNGHHGAYEVHFAPGIIPLRSDAKVEF
jgi:hypothetical protein